MPPFNLFTTNLIFKMNYLFRTLVALLITLPVFAQQHQMAVDSTMKPGKKMEMGGMAMMADTTKSMMMNSQYSLSLPMNRDGSGSSWVPDETPVYAYMVPGDKWTTMVHGSFFAMYNNQDLFKSGSRGGKIFDVPDWIMAMTQRKVGGNGLFSINTMFSFDPLLVGLQGYPLLYQTGESYKGKPLVDIQHPHNLFAELSANYTEKISKNADVNLSLGYPGEPALGPPVFMHRLSGMDDPDAPLGHHYQDATHITFGVATLGFRYRDVKLEGSIFNGREPDGNRYGFDPIRLDSYSLRLSYNPSKEWALQISNGWLHSPEQLEPLENIIRTTASAMYTKMLDDNSYIASTLVYGQNHYSDNGKTLPSILFENSLQLNKTAIYSRYELVDKDAEELALTGIFPANPNFDINAITLGTNRILGTYKQTNITGGVQATLNVSPGMLRPLYGTSPLGFEFYIRINPALMKMKESDTMGDMDM
jgi:hypothetical protein